MLATILANGAKPRLDLVKLEEEGSLASALHKIARPRLVQHAQPVSPTVRDNATIIFL